MRKSIVITAILCIHLSSANDSQNPSFSLPEDLTKWQEVTTAYMQPVLSTDELSDKWKTLLDLTMPQNGHFDPINKHRREQTIILSYEKMTPLSDENRLLYLNGLLNRHKQYVHTK